MATRIFDRETLLDLTVNFVPLFIILFFTVAFLVVSPFGFDPMTSALQFGLLAIPFVALALLTYLSGRALAGDEKRAPVYVPGQATTSTAKPLETHDHTGETTSEPEVETGASEADTEGADETNAQGTDEADAERAEDDAATNRKNDT